MAAIQVATGEITTAGTTWTDTIAITSDGTFHVCYRRKELGVWASYLARSTDGGSTWTEELVSTNSYSLAIITDSSDNLWVSECSGVAPPGPVTLYKVLYQGGSTWETIVSAQSWIAFADGYFAAMELDEANDRIIMATYFPSTYQRSMIISTEYWGQIDHIGQPWSYPQLKWIASNNRLYYVSQTYAIRYASVSTAQCYAFENWIWTFVYKYRDSTGEPNPYNYGVKAVVAGDYFVACRVNDNQLEINQSLINDVLLTGTTGALYPWDYTQKTITGEYSNGWLYPLDDLNVRAYWYNPSTKSIWRSDFNLVSKTFGAEVNTDLTASQTGLLFGGGEYNGNNYTYLDKNPDYLNGTLYINEVNEPVANMGLIDCNITNMSFVG